MPTSHDLLGYIACRRTIIPVTRIFTEDGQFVVTGELRGPVDAYAEGEVALYSPDGILVKRGTGLTWRQIGSHEVLTARLRLRFTEKEEGTMQKCYCLCKKCALGLHRYCRNCRGDR